MGAHKTAPVIFMMVLYISRVHKAAHAQPQGQSHFPKQQNKEDYFFWNEVSGDVQWEGQ